MYQEPIISDLRSVAVVGTQKVWMIRGAKIPLPGHERSILAYSVKTLRESQSLGIFTTIRKMETQKVLSGSCINFCATAIIKCIYDI